MSTFPEQFSAARTSQVEAQINFFQNFTTKAFASAQKIVALNLSLSRAALEKSSAAVTELLAAKDPRDLFALTKRTQESIDGLLAYNRELVAIATGAGVALSEQVAEVKPAALALVKAAQAAQAAPAAPAAPAMPATQPEPEPQAAAPAFVAPVAEPEVAGPANVTATPASPPQAKATPIAKAVSKATPKAVAAKPAAASFPAAAKPLTVTGIKPVDASPPSAAVSGKIAVAQQQLDLAAGKSKRKK